MRNQYNENFIKIKVDTSIMLLSSYLKKKNNFYKIRTEDIESDFNYFNILKLKGLGK